MKKYEIRYGAVGGQGIITAGALLVDIAVELENKFAIESPTYTAAVRGGPTKVDVIISDEKIDFPHATAIDFFLCTDQRPYDIYKESLKDDAIVVVDSHLVRDARRHPALEALPGADHQRDQGGGGQRGADLGGQPGRHPEADQHHHLRPHGGAHQALGPQGGGGDEHEGHRSRHGT